MGNVLSPSASGEFNVLKVENSTSAKMGLDASGAGKGGVARRLREAIDPVASAETYAAAARIVGANVRDIAKDLVEAGTPREYAVAQAYEIYRGAEKLTSLGKALFAAENALESDKEYTMPCQRFVSDFRVATEGVSDDEILDLFGQVLVGEMESPGSVSKRTLDILAEMSKEEATTFLRLCSFSIVDDDGGIVEVVLRSDSGSALYNKGNFSYNDLLALEAIGLVSLNVYVPIQLRPFGAVSVLTKSCIVEASKESNYDLVANLSEVTLTRSGRELSIVGEPGSAEGLETIIKEIFEAEKCTVVIEEREALQESR